MADQTQPDIQYVQTKNRAIEYELKQKEKGNPYTLQELKASHHNHMLDRGKTRVPLRWLRHVGTLITEVLMEKKAVEEIGVTTQYDLEDALQSILFIFKREKPLYYEYLKVSIDAMVKDGYEDRFE